MPDFKVKNSERIYEGRVVALSVETIELPGGREARREVVRHPGATAIVPMISEREVILIKQFRYCAEKELWEIPAGTLEPGETPLECAERELIEEIGYRAGKMTPIGGFFTSPGFCDEFLRLYLATELEPCEADRDEDEQLTPHRMPLEQALRKIDNGEIVDAKTIVGLLRVGGIGPETIKT
jgi:ADP-ribose pyrophosphatase